jgi:formylmethanofuran dehydrogenase subunit E
MQTQRLNRKAIEKKVRANSNAITNIIANAKNNQILPTDLKKLRVLLAESQKLASQLHPKINIPSNYRNEELTRIETEYNLNHGFIPKEARCSTCGEPYRNNKMNGVPWCIGCQKPFKAAEKNILVKKNLPKKVNVTEEEVKEFESKRVA